MAALTKQQFIAEADKLAALFLALAPSLIGGATSSTTPGFGDNTIVSGAGTDYGAQLKARDLQTLLDGWNDPDHVRAQFGQMDALIGLLSMQRQIPLLLSSMLQGGFTTDCNKSGYSGVLTIDSFASYFNTGAGGNWQALLPPDYAALHSLIFGAAPNPFNVYPLQKLVSPGLGALATGTFTPAATPVDTTKYAGFLPSMILGVVTSDMTIATGSGTIKLKGNGVTANGTANAPGAFTGDFASHTLSCTVTGATVAAGTILVFTGSAADVYQVLTGLQLTNVSAGAFWVAGMPPTTAPAAAPAGSAGVTVPSGVTRTSPPV